MNEIFWGAITRTLQAALHASPTILVGIVVAAVFRSFMGYKLTRMAFGGETWRQIPQAWGLGMLLPVCSMGAIPIMTELRRAGLAGGAILAFGLTAPIFNPLSILYGLSLSQPIVILTICLCSLVIVSLLGWIWDWSFPGSRQSSNDNEVIAPGIRRIATTALTAARVSADSNLWWWSIGAGSVGLLSVFLPLGAVQQWAEHSDPFAPLRMASISFPAYLTPMDAMVQMSEMFKHGNSIAAAFTLLILGTGVNMGMIAWSFAHDRWYQTLTWLFLLIVLVVGLAYLIDGPLYPKGITPEGHTHAYDQFCRPSFGGESPASASWKIIRDETKAFEGISLCLLGMLVVTGIALQRFDPSLRIESRLLNSASRRQPKQGFDFVLPQSIVTVATVASLIAASVVGCFIYYPAKDVLFSQLQQTNAEVFTRSVSQDKAGALLWIPIFEDQMKKLDVSLVLRGESMTDSQRSSSEQIESLLEILEHAVQDEHFNKASYVANRISIEYQKFRQSFRESRPIDRDASEIASLAPSS